MTKIGSQFFQKFLEDSNAGKNLSFSTEQDQGLRFDSKECVENLNSFLFKIQYFI